MPKRPIQEFKHRNDTISQDVYDIPSGALKRSYWDPFPWDQLYRYYVGTTTYDYRGKRKRKESLPENPYTMHRTVWSDGSGREEWIDGNEKIVTYVPNCFYWYRFGPLDSAHGMTTGPYLARNLALKRLGEKASRVKFNAAQFLGERKQLANLLEDTASRIYQAMRALKRCDVRSFMRSLSLSGGWSGQVAKAFQEIRRTPINERLARHWLEFIYGWRPLLSDVYDAAELLAQKIETNQLYNGVIRASAKSLDVKNYPYVAGEISPQVEIRVLYRCRFKAHYRLDDDARMALSQTGISNPLLLAWELLPFSFVVDWFYPVGNYLEALTQFDGFTLLSGTEVNIREGHSHIWHNASYQSGPFWSKKRTGEHQVDETEYVRTQLMSWPSYALHLRSPLGGNAYERVATAISLMRVIMGSTKLPTQGLPSSRSKGPLSEWLPSSTVVNSQSPRHHAEWLIDINKQRNARAKALDKFLRD